MLEVICFSILKEKIPNSITNINLQIVLPIEKNGIMKIVHLLYRKSHNV